MKKLVLFILLFVFFLENIGVLVVLKLRQAQVKNEIKYKLEKAIPEKELIIVIETESNKNLFTWKDEKEFFYQSRLFDVVYKKTQGSTRVYYCIDDKQEALLITKLDNWMQQNERSTNSLKNSFDYLMQFLANISSSSQYFYAFNLDGDIKHHEIYCFTYSYLYSVIAYSPPKV